jgi:hypothetical protein
MGNMNTVTMSRFEFDLLALQSIVLSGASMAAVHWLATRFLPPLWAWPLAFAVIPLVLGPLLIVLAHKRGLALGPLRLLAMVLLAGLAGFAMNALRSMGG